MNELKEKSNKKYLENLGLNADIINNEVFYIEDINSLDISDIKKRIHSPVYYVVEDKNYFICDQKNNIFSNSNIYNSKVITQGKHRIYICEHPLMALALRNKNENAVYVKKDAEKELINLIDKYATTSLFIFDGNKYEQTKKFCDEKNMKYVDVNYKFVNYITSIDNYIEKVNFEINRLIESYNLDNSSFGYSKKMEEYINSKNGKNIYKTGFDKLDEQLKGGFRSELIIIGAVSSLGKTTFVLQLADQMAKDGKDVLIFSLEMSRYELMAKSISRESYVLNKNNQDKEMNALTTLDILENNVDKNKENQFHILDKSKKKYNRYSDHIFIHEGSTEMNIEYIKEVVNNHIRITGEKPVVIIDYLQILASQNDRLNEKQITDNNVGQLKTISRDRDIPIIVISSFNRESYNSSVSMLSFKESGAIEYTSDVLIGLQNAEMDYHQNHKKEQKNNFLKNMREDNYRKADEGQGIDVELKILKRRNSAPGKVSFTFYPKYNFFEEKTRI
jgi:replicative DNA helicase